MHLSSMNQVIYFVATGTVLHITIHLCIHVSASLLFRGRREGDELLGLEPRLDDHDGVERPVAAAGAVPGDDLQVVRHPGDDLLLRRDHAGEGELERDGVAGRAAAAVAEVAVVLGHREPAQGLHLLVGTHVLDLRPAAHRDRRSVRCLGGGDGNEGEEEECGSGEGGGGHSCNCVLWRRDLPAWCLYIGTVSSRQ